MRVAPYSCDDATPSSPLRLLLLPAAMFSADSWRRLPCASPEPCSSTPPAPDRSTDSPHCCRPSSATGPASSNTATTQSRRPPPSVFSFPPGSPSRRRVTVSREHYIYDDGPSKTVYSTDTLALDVASSTYTESATGKRAANLQSLRLRHPQGGPRRTHPDAAPASDNNKPAESPHHPHHPPQSPRLA